MRDGFIRVAAATPKVRVADTVFNGEQVIRLMEEGYEKGAKLMVFPELCLTAYTCGDLFSQQTLLDGALEALRQVIRLRPGRTCWFLWGCPGSAAASCTT